MDFSRFQKILAQNKVYDAWQYVQSLNETLEYGHITPPASPHFSRNSSSSRGSNNFRSLKR